MGGWVDGWMGGWVEAVVLGKHILCVVVRLSGPLFTVDELAAGVGYARHCIVYHHSSSIITLHRSPTHHHPSSCITAIIIVHVSQSSAAAARARMRTRTGAQMHRRMRAHAHMHRRSASNPLQLVPTSDSPDDACFPVRSSAHAQACAPHAPWRVATAVDCGLCPLRHSHACWTGLWQIRFYLSGSGLAYSDDGCGDQRFHYVRHIDDGTTAALPFTANLGHDLGGSMYLRIGICIDVGHVDKDRYECRYWGVAGRLELAGQHVSVLGAET